MKYFKKIEGKRVYLSPISLDDAEVYVKWLNDRSVTDKTHGTSRLVNIVTEKEWIQSNLQSNDYSFAAVLQDTDQLIGNCGLMNVNFLDRTAELGIFIGEEAYRNQGYGFEMIQLVLEYGFQILNLHNINLKVFDFNERAIHCYQKAGFQICGRRHECYFLDGVYHDEIQMEILEKDWRDKK